MRKYSVYCILWHMVQHPIIPCLHIMYIVWITYFHLFKYYIGHSRGAFGMDYCIVFNLHKIWLSCQDCCFYNTQITRISRLTQGNSCCHGARKHPSGALCPCHVKGCHGDLQGGGCWWICGVKWRGWVNAEKVKRTKAAWECTQRDRGYCAVTPSPPPRSVRS